MDESQVLEVIEMYEDLVEKQDEIIVRQSRFIKKVGNGTCPFKKFNEC